MIYYRKKIRIFVGKIESILKSVHLNMAVKNKILPQWLDDIIFEEYGAKYEPRPQDVEYNPDKSFDFVKLYLGTYFPRSYSEAYCIVQNMLSNKEYFQQICDIEEINVLDFCCGTGGEIFGLIDVLQHLLPNLKKINIDAFDANSDAIKFLFQIMIRACESSHIHVNININPQCFFIASEQDLEDLVNMTNVQYHFIMSFKAINEFIQHKTFDNKNVYTLVSSHLAPLLSQQGLLILSDVTTKMKGDNWYPKVLTSGINVFVRTNNEYKSIYPYSCYYFDTKCGGCYLQDIIKVSHSRRTNDISKIAYRIVCRKQLADIIISNIDFCSCGSNAYQK